MTEKHESDYRSYWRVMGSRRLPKRLRFKPIVCERIALKHSKFLCGKKIAQIITDIV